MTIPDLSESWLTLIGQGLTFLTALMAALVGLYNRRSIAETQAKVQEVHLVINSRMSEMMELTKKASFSEGREDETLRSRSMMQGMQDRSDAETVRQRDETEEIRARTEKANAAAPGTVKVEGPGTVSITGATTPEPKIP